MAEIILDFGSGNTCKNDKRIVKQMLEALRDIDKGEHDVVVKWQLFKEAGDNIPLDYKLFDYAYFYARMLGYPVTASVFDMDSLDCLLNYDVPFVKIANRRDLDWLVNHVPRRVPVYLSSDDPYYRLNGARGDRRILACVSKYPAMPEEYEQQGLFRGCYISDHTTDFKLWHKYKPEIIEWHYRLEDSNGLDAGPFARTPAQLEEIL